jgi:glycerophosphoryl diester phosphodiesterase
MACFAKFVFAVFSFFVLLMPVSVFGIELIAHRGYSNVAPENTLESIYAAANRSYGTYTVSSETPISQATFTEFDICTTEDGEYVLMHGYLEETTDWNLSLGWGNSFSTHGHVAVSTFDELRTLDAGNPAVFGNEFAGTQIPSMFEAIDASLECGLTPLVEMKWGNSLPFWNAFKEHYGYESPDDAGMLQDCMDRMVIQCFSWTFLTDLDNLAKADGALDDPNIGALDMLVLGGGDLLQAENADFVSQAHAQGLDVFAYTINYQIHTDRLLDLGVDGIVTDLPGTIVVPEPSSVFVLLSAAIFLSTFLWRREKVNG